VRFTLECYFDRAMRFAPDDENVKVLYAVYLQRRGRNAEALDLLSKVSVEAGESANIHYNLGLLYLELGRFDEALQHAHAAYRLGFALPGLRNRLVRAGKWKDDTVASPAAR
jgi:tetratricopeptide (TPR) repeat protein